MSEGFTYWWQHLPERIDPYLLELGSFRISYYGLMYVVAFAVVYLLCLYRIRRGETEYTAGDVENYLVWAALGLIAGARLGYVLFYNFGYYLRRPLEIFLPFSFEGGFHFTGISGMSYHGGAIGVALASVLFCRKYRVGFRDFGDFLIPSVPLAYTFGRLGNFINGELFGRPTDLPWGMYFPRDPQGLLRHPSQLYEAFFEGIFLFAVLWPLRNRRPFRGFHLSLYLVGYGTVRFFIEFVRQPDVQLGAVLGPFTMGQVLCAAMVALGGAVFALGKRPSL
ncbi:MAG: prolipoprotein diacylglyceryl transferase [Nitrospirota bacterium]